MSGVFALRAGVQCLLEQRDGIWQTVTDMCMATGADSARVRHVLHQLVDAGTAHLAVVGGVEHFGIGVEGVPPPFQTSHLGAAPSPEERAQ